MLFSLRRKAPKDSLRLSPQTPLCYWEAHTHTARKVLQCSRGSHRPPLAVRRVTATGKPAPAGAKLSERSCCPFGVFRRGLHEFTSANTCREPTRYAIDLHKRSSGTLAASFRSFLVRTRKEHAPPFQRRIYVLFSLRRKAPKDSLRLPPQTPIVLLGSTYPRLERCCSARGARTGHHSPCGERLPLESLRPQAQGCRIALAARSACSAVDCVPLRYANTCREPTRYTLGSHKRSSGTLAASFRSFLVRTRKEHVPPFQRRKYVFFSAGEKRYQKEAFS